MSVMEEILRLAELGQVEPNQVIHFVTGRSASGDVNIEVPTKRCIAVTRIDGFNLSSSSPSSVASSSAGQSQESAAQNMAIAVQGDVLYVFHSGKVVLTFVLIAALDVHPASVQVIYYELPEEALENLNYCATRVVEQT